MKHYIEDLVDACPGVQDIDNRIRVDASSGRWSDDPRSGASGTSAMSSTATTPGSTTSSGVTGSGVTGSGVTSSPSTGKTGKSN
jgi:hypothetical protein